MQPTEETKIIQFLLARLERVSVDSYWAHRASGIRGALLRTLEEIEKGTSTGRSYTNEIISSAYIMPVVTHLPWHCPGQMCDHEGYKILIRAAREKH
jgi:hypothetical protein